MVGTGSMQAYRGSLEKLIARIDAARGLDLRSYRRPYLERRIAARLRAVGLHSYRQYAELLESDPDELEALINTLTINVTDFFRDKGMWDVVHRKVLPEIVERKRHARVPTIRCWSAGCATGEEPYSLAMLLLDVLGDRAEQVVVSVTATDLDREALAKAERGIYRREQLRRVPPGYRARFMRLLDDGSYEVLPHVRRLVRFQRTSLFDPTPLRMMDLIMCRNVFIYFDHDEQARVLGQFVQALARGGYLILGRSEKLKSDIAADFEVIDGKERVYRRPLVRQ